MSGRSYLSIGDVLTLLRQEFPDVTISKIRFLESQGLVNPERTPSGYRKFYDHDVERLRWVLRQQREHFLPLKVIKDRLEDDGAGEGASGSVAGPTGHADAAEAVPAAPESVHSGKPAEEPVLVGQRAGPSAGEQRPASRVGGSSTLPGIESPLAGSPVGAGPVGAADRGVTGVHPTGATPVSRTAEPGRTSPVGRADDAVSPEPPAAVGGTETADHRGSGKPSRSASTTSAGPPARQRRSRGAPGAAPAPTREGNGAAAGATGQAGGTNMSIEELAASSGLDPEVLLELQGYGLLTPTVIAGLDYYDEESLAVATAAARFAQFGIEPRHLRPYKNAAVREAGFIEQIVLPLLRQRNPEARARARETVDELSDLGLQMQGALLRTALRGMLGD